VKGLPKEMTVEIAKLIEKAVKFLVKVMFILMGICLALQILLCWISSIHLSPGDKLEFWLVLGVASMIAYFIRKHRSPARAQASTHHGSERTPLMPRRGGKR
jgi:preprotein translocase subunit SecG